MPAPPLANTFEGGSDTTTITTGNSGGGSGDAFSNITIGASSGLTFSATQARDTLSMANTQPATGAPTYAEWQTLGSLTSNHYVRFYMYIGAAPAGGPMMCRFFSSAAAASGGLVMTTGRLLRSVDSLIGTLGTGVIAVPTSAWVRVEMRAVASTTAGEMEVRWYSATSPGDGVDGTTPTETIGPFTSVVNAANHDRVRLGIATGTNGWTNQTWYFDDYAVSTTDWIGPSGGTPPISDADEKLRVVQSNLRNL